MRQFELDDVQARVLGYIASKYVERKTTAKAKEALAYVAARIVSDGLPPFPSQVKEAGEALQELGEARNRELAEHIKRTLGTT